MGKRSDFARIERDFYPTPPAAVAPLLPFLKPKTLFVEPCAGDGALVGHLEAEGHRCVWESDIAPQRPMIEADALRLNYLAQDCIITNPPWSRPALHALIEWFSDQALTWLLFDADWMHTRQATPYLPRLRQVVSVGRVKWIADSPHTGKDNCCWYLFGKPSDIPALFFGRT